MKRSMPMMPWIAAAIAMLAVAGCGAQQGKWTSEAAHYAAYATQIPLYPGTRIVDTMGSESWGDAPNSYSYGMTWWCETKASKDDMLSWYSEKLPGATRSTPYDNAIELTVTPEGASPNEDMGVIVTEDGKYLVFEHRKAKEIRS